MRCIQVTDSDWEYLTKLKVDTKAKRVADVVTKVIKEANLSTKSKS